MLNLTVRCFYNLGVENIILTRHILRKYIIRKYRVNTTKRSRQKQSNKDKISNQTGLHFVEDEQVVAWDHMNHKIYTYTFETQQNSIRKYK